jgi:hypothetical protein
MPQVSREYQDPIDNVIYDSSNHAVSIFKKLNFTANDITTVSNISMCITLLLLLHAKYYWACLFLFLAYYFDCLDGLFARTYKQTSKFGEMYDHYSDLVKGITLLMTLYYINPTKFVKIMPIIIIICITTFTYSGCIDIINKEDTSYSSFSKCLCPITDVDNKEEVDKHMKTIRYLGPGISQLIMIVIIIYFSQ